MKFTIRQDAFKNNGEKTTLPVYTVWGSDGENRSKFASIREIDICEDHGSAGEVALVIVSALSAYFANKTPKQ